MNMKTIVQDILNVVLVIALTGTALSSKLQPLVSASVYDWLTLVLAGALLLVYNADSIFGFTNTHVPTPPTQPTPNAN
jgi:hypothetical protein